jgi:hypothetical protein
MYTLASKLGSRLRVYLGTSAAECGAPGDAYRPNARATRLCSVRIKQKFVATRHGCVRR